jgi:hypothetical protein
VDLPDRRVAERAADVRAAAVVAFVLDGRPVVDPWAPVAVVPAPAQLGVEGIEQVRVEGADGLGPDQRADVLGPRS